MTISHNLFEVNDMALFTCTCQDDTKLVAHSKQVCIIVSLCDENKYDREDVGYMYNIRFEDGYEHQAFEDELTKVNRFELDTTLNDPWFVYEIGDIFHNDNGDDYIILAMDKDSDKMILAKKTKLGDENITFFIGAKGIGMHHWSHGHYFMQNFEAACNWFNEVEEDDDEDDITVKNITDKLMGPLDSVIFICNTNDYKYYRFLDTSIPDELSDCKIKAIMVKTFYVKPIDDDVTGLTLYIDFEANNVNNDNFHQDYASYEV